MSAFRIGDRVTSDDPRDYPGELFQIEEVDVETAGGAACKVSSFTLRGVYRLERNLRHANLSREWST